MNTFTYQYLDDASIRVDNITLRPWPDFFVEGDASDKANRIICDLLESEDPLVLLWRGKIPKLVLETICEFPPCLWRGLLEVSQLHPEYFVQWSKTCPALIGLIAMHDACSPTDRDIDRVRAFYRGRKARLEILGLPPTKEVFSILMKVSVEDCYPRQLKQLRGAIRDKSHRKLMRHLTEITTETLDTLQLPIEYLTVNILNMRQSEQMPAQCESVFELCQDLAHFRQVLRMHPYWPYTSSDVTLHQLIQARNALELRLALGKDCKTVKFPSPPVECIDSSKVKIVPLTSVRELFREGNSMKNCIMTYARNVIDGYHYAYRMLYPERATILLVKRPDDWYPVEIRGPGNIYASVEVIDLVHAWVGTRNEGKEIPYDFPF